MQSGTETAPVSKKWLWAGYIISGLSVLFMLFDSVLHLLKPAAVVEAFTRLGYPDSLARGLGAVELVCIVVYVIPRSSILGAILLTGYLGGATATQVRVGDQFVFPVAVGVFIWAGLFLRDQRVRALIPLKTAMGRHEGDQ